MTVVQPPFLERNSERYIFFLIGQLAMQSDASIYGSSICIGNSLFEKQLGIN